MSIDKMRWYKVIIDGRDHIVRVDDRIMKYCVIDYYEGKLWFTGSCVRCKDCVKQRLDRSFIHYDMQQKGAVK